MRRAIIHSPDGTIESTFAWGLGISSNNEAKAYALYKGLSILHGNGIRPATVIGNSTTIIRSFIMLSLPAQESLLV